MAKCEFSTKCPIAVNQDKVLWRKAYATQFCNFNCEACERRKIRLAQGQEAVPVDLLPDGKKHTGSVFRKDW